MQTMTVCRKCFMGVDYATNVCNDWIVLKDVVI